MIKLTVNTDAVMTKLKELSPDLAKEVRRALNTGGLLVQGEAKKLVNRNSSGSRPAFRYKNGSRRRVMVSRKGQPPNTDLGRLVKNIVVEMGRGNMLKQAAVSIISRAPYSAILENKLKRPFMSLAAQRMEKKVKALVLRAVRSAL